MNVIKRIPWLDSTKFFAIFCVVLGHVLGFLTNHEIVGYELVQGIIVSFNMPLFFILSGFSSGEKILNIAKLQELLFFILNSTIRILLPAYGLSTVIYVMGMGEGWVTYFWFLPILWRLLMVFAICAFAFNVIVRYCKTGGRVVLGGVALFLIISFFLGNRMSEFSTYIVFGYFLRKQQLLDKLSKNWMIFLFILYCIGLYFTIGKNFYVVEYQYHELINGQFYILLLRQISAVTLSVIIIKIFYQYSGKYNKFSYLGSITLGIYLIHDFIIEIWLSKYLNFCLPSLNSFIEYMIIFILTISVIVFSSIVIALLRKNRLLKLLLLGEDSYKISNKVCNLSTTLKEKYRN